VLDVVIEQTVQRNIQRQVNDGHGKKIRVRMEVSADILSDFSKTILTYAVDRVFSNYPQNLWITLWKATGKTRKKRAAIGFSRDA
ncbi:MAG: hypothetical protein LBF51_06560, partial [Zoogloeaceae bacterium]|nr:hypothetical protein [Zoogloeaceae bacterium]